MTVPKPFKVGDIKKNRLSKYDKRMWENFMTPEYVFTENGKEFVYMKFVGWDKMAAEHKIITIDEAKASLKKKQ